MTQEQKVLRDGGSSADIMNHHLELPLKPSMMQKRFKPMKLGGGDFSKLDKKGDNVSKPKFESNSKERPVFRSLQNNNAVNHSSQPKDFTSNLTQSKNNPFALSKQLINARNTQPKNSYLNAESADRKKQTQNPLLFEVANNNHTSKQTINKNSETRSRNAKNDHTPSALNKSVILVEKSRRQPLHGSIDHVGSTKPTDRLSARASVRSLSPGRNSLPPFDAEECSELAVESQAHSSEADDLLNHWFDLELTKNNATYNEEVFKVPELDPNTSCDELDKGFLLEHSACDVDIRHNLKRKDSYEALESLAALQVGTFSLAEEFSKNENAFGRKTQPQKSRFL